MYWNDCPVGMFIWHTTQRDTVHNLKRKKAQRNVWTPIIIELHNYYICRWKLRDKCVWSSMDQCWWWVVNKDGDKGEMAVDSGREREKSARGCCCCCWRRSLGTKESSRTPQHPAHCNLSADAPISGLSQLSSAKGELFPCFITQKEPELG